VAKRYVIQQKCIISKEEVPSWEHDGTTFNPSDPERHNTHRHRQTDDSIVPIADRRPTAKIFW